ncbi:hypothetical protein C8F01DRAFT_1141173 [Mycena amicta]|nr:hypothetical protein C8F01DRAFT_1141173 [Mycena amicta]
MTEGEGYQLPQELIDTIVDIFADTFPDGNATLRACALAARAFVRPCQQRLFESVKLYTARHANCTRGDIASAVNTTKRLAQLLDASPHLGAYVKNVSIAFPKTVPDEEGSDYIRALSNVFSAFPAIDVLSLEPRAINWDDIWNIYSIPTDLVDAMVPVAPCTSLRRLELTRTHFTTINELEDAISVAPNLRDLVLRDIMIYQVDEAAPPLRAASRDKRATLESLELRVVPSYFFQEALEAFTHVATITNLRSVCMDEYDDLILRTNAATLEEIVLIRRHGQDVHLIGTALLDLLSGDVLRSLHLKLTSDLTNLHTNIQHIRVLTNTRTSFAHGKTIFINLQDAGLLYSLLSDIDDLFGGVHLHPGPERVVMQLGFDGGVERVRELMPLLKAKGVLEVVQMSSGLFPVSCLRLS